MRELANTLERAAILSRGSALDLSGLDLGARVPRSPSSPQAPRSFAEASRACLAAALRASRGKLYGPDGAAALLELKPSTFQTKMRKLGIRRADFVE